MLQMHENELETAVNEEREAALMLQMQKNELETAVNLTPAPDDDLSRMGAYDDLEALPSVTSRSLMLDGSEYGEQDTIFHSHENEVSFYRPCVKMHGIKEDPRVIQSTPSAPAAACPTSEEELSFDRTLGSASPDHQALGITRNDDFEDLSMSKSRANRSQTSKSIFSIMSSFTGNASRGEASMSFGGLSDF